MPFDPYDDHKTALDSPAQHIEVVTPNDSSDLVRTTRAINASGSGTIRLRTLDGSEGDLYVVAGTVMPIRAIRVYATGTTATGIRGLS